MSADLREAVALAMLAADGAHYSDPAIAMAVADSRYRHLVDAALTAARPVIEAQVREACAVIVETAQFPDTVLGDNRREDGKFKRASRLSVNTQPPRYLLAAAIRSQP